MRESGQRLILPDAAATERLGEQLAHGLGDALVSPPLMYSVIHLTGDLGAGKTTLVRGLLRALGVQGLVRSPTYTLVEPYEVAKGTVVHIDLYRLQSPREFETLGLEDYLRPRHALLIEWPQRGGDAVPPPDLEIDLSYPEDAATGRVARLVHHTEAGRALLTHVAV